eukprot:TRINITY_DN114874_c0_g1_i1.p1 TRINITY_DN114874_c0_g1~~TRINITY_DN114874_c0_g1_i1.p1  ORF type:complete len:263 (+),score=87.57 TRINITY_DN114874_c0_g1_i1:103-891(+)
MVARAKKQLMEEGEVTDYFQLPPPMSDEEDEFRRARKAKGRCKDRERSIKSSKRQALVGADAAPEQLQADEKEQEAPMDGNEDTVVERPKSGRCNERERSVRSNRKSQACQDSRGEKSRGRKPLPAEALDTAAGDPTDFIAAMKAKGQKLVEAREQEILEQELVKTEEDARREIARRRRDLQAREAELRELHDLQQLKAEAEKAVAAVRAVADCDKKEKERSRSGSSGERTKTVAFSDMVHAEPAKDAAESPFEDLYGWVVL